MPSMFIVPIQTASIPDKKKARLVLKKKAICGGLEFFDKLNRINFLL